jgi:ATP-dependent RNA helicase DDX35
LRPSDEDFGSSTNNWKEDKVDIDAIRETSFVYNASPSLALAAQRQRLPIAKNKEHILYLLEKHQVVIVVGETGSGKSTQVPQYLIEAGWCADKGSMVNRQH